MSKCSCVWTYQRLLRWDDALSRGAPLPVTEVHGVALDVADAHHGCAQVGAHLSQHLVDTCNRKWKGQSVIQLIKN